MRHGISSSRLVTLLTESGFASIIFGYGVFPCCCRARQVGDLAEATTEGGLLAGPHCCSDPLGRPSALPHPIVNGTSSRGANARAGGGLSMSSAHMLTGLETHSGVIWKIRAAISSILSRESIKRSRKSLVARCVCLERLCKADWEIAHGMRLPAVLINDVRRFPPRLRCKRLIPLGFHIMPKIHVSLSLKQQIPNGSAVENARKYMGTNQRHTRHVA